MPASTHCSVFSPPHVIMSLRQTYLPVPLPPWPFVLPASCTSSSRPFPGPFRSTCRRSRSSYCRCVSRVCVWGGYFCISHTFHLPPLSHPTCLPLSLLLYGICSQIRDAHASELGHVDKLPFFREVRHTFGRTALLLSGGGSLGTFHMVSAEGGEGRKGAGGLMATHRCQCARLCRGGAPLRLPSVPSSIHPPSPTAGRVQGAV